MEQRVLESFLREIDVADMQFESIKRSTKSKKRCAETSPVSNSRPSWKRRKEQLERLRVEAKTLGMHVAFLSLARTHNAMMNAAFGVSQDQLKWAIALKTEKRQCQEAKEENERLKAKLQHCTQVCASLRVLLTQNSSNIGLPRAIYELPALNIFGLDMLESKVDERLGKLEAIIRETLVHTPETDTDRVQVHRMNNTEDAGMLELKRTRLIPFDAKETSETMWSIMKLGVASDENSIRITKSSKSTRASEGCLTESLECGGSVKIRTRCVMRRVPIPDGFLVLIEAVTEWLARPKHLNEWRHVTRDSGWAAVYPVHVASDGPTPRVCQIKTSLCLQTNDCADIEPGITPSLLSRAVSDVVVPSFRKILSSRNQLLDNRLLDSSLA
ncbi:hypothetical protein P3T76_010259 [Phytophthora citrophthora]|uniref:START domain-containing protein n=1 Tax=Phytophthora citrophthora TaxID=4793 RepID=A0AAD9GC05_9STRA|nr:hypothetical protein P3T76_010259 [Phytophthora citrophthora]